MAHVEQWRRINDVTWERVDGVRVIDPDGDDVWHIVTEAGAYVADRCPVCMKRALGDATGRLIADILIPVVRLSPAVTCLEDGARP